MRTFTLLIFTFFIINFSLAQVADVEFGKNRIQYHDDFDEWSRYESTNFVTYWYGKSKNVGRASVMFAEYFHDEIFTLLEHRINDKIELIVYSDITDMKQSNIGVEQAMKSVQGETNVIGNKMFVYYDGNYNNLEKQIKEGIAKIYLNYMLLGSNLQEMVQNAVLMNLPLWFEKGLVAYIGDNWNLEIDDDLRNQIMNKEYETFAKLMESSPRLTGHAIWNYIAIHYGKSNLTNIVYLTRLNRNIENSILYVLGVDYYTLIEKIDNFYSKRYKTDFFNKTAFPKEGVKIKNRFDVPINSITFSPNGQKMAYVTNDIGKYKIYIKDFSTGKDELISKGNYRNGIQATDYNYPILAWKPNNLELGIIYEKRDVIYYANYDIRTNDLKVEPMAPAYDRVLSMDFIDNTQFVMSAIVGGFSDLFLYFTNTRQSTRITSDYFDDLDPVIVNLENHHGILFSSNRTDSLLVKHKLDSFLPGGNYDLYYYDLSAKPKELLRLTYTENENERHPKGVDTTYFTYLSDESGIWNRKAGYLKDVEIYKEKVILLKDSTEIVISQDSTLKNLAKSEIESITLRPVYKKKAFVHLNSNGTTNILNYDIATQTKEIIQSVKIGDEYFIFKDSLDPTFSVAVSLTQFRLLEQDKISISDLDNPEMNDNTQPVVQTPKKVSKKKSSGYFFQSEFDDPEPVKEEIKDEIPEPIEVIPSEIEVISTASNESDPLLKANDKERIIKLKSSRIVPYRLRFRSLRPSLKFDNSVLFEGLNSYAGTQNKFEPTPPGILFKIHFKEVLEDYEMEAGLRFPTSFSGKEGYVYFDNKKRRLDKRFALYRRNNTTSEQAALSKSTKNKDITSLGLARLSYPLDVFTSIRGTFTLRNDKKIKLASDAASLNAPNLNEQRVGAKFEFIFDNSLDVHINIKNGTRAKTFVEVVKKFELNYVDKVNFSFNKGFMTIFGFDARHYQRLDKKSIFAIRAAGASSFGSEQMLYHLGDSDQSLFGKFNNNIPTPENGNFAYRALAQNLRGFKRNIRNGTSYLLLNTELRIPVMLYLKRQINSSFWRNLQVVGFYDVGTAWHGKSPFDENNPTNTSTFSDANETVVIKVNYYRHPIVMGYGVGLRSMILGYFVRLDYAWGVETGIVQKPRIHLSFGYDF